MCAIKVPSHLHAKLPCFTLMSENVLSLINRDGAICSSEKKNSNLKETFTVSICWEVASFCKANKKVVRNCHKVAPANQSQFSRVHLFWKTTAVRHHSIHLDDHGAAIAYPIIDQYSYAVFICNINVPRNYKPLI